MTPFAWVLVAVAVWLLTLGAITAVFITSTRKSRREEAATAVAV